MIVQVDVTKMAEGNQNIIQEEGNVQGQEENPLLNPVVMDKVFSFVESKARVKDLKNFRLVCKTWSDSSLKVWRKVAPLRLGPPERSIRTRSQSLLGAQPTGNYLPVNKYLEFMTSSPDPLQFQQKPFVNLVLCRIDFIVSVPTCLKLTSTRGLGSTNLWNYLNNGQGQVKSFGLMECRFISKLDFTRIFLEKLGFVKNVSLVNNREMGMLTMEDYIKLEGMTQVVHVTQVEISGDVPMDFGQMMQSCHSLEKLTIRCNYQYHRCNLRNFVSDQNGLNGYHVMKSLEALKSRFFGNDRQAVAFLVHVWSLGRIRFPLELLTLTLETYHPFHRGMFDAASIADLIAIFHPFVRLFSSTLKTLKVFRAPIHNVFPNGQQLFPEEMPVLEELHLYGNLVSGFGFLEQTPNLKVLRIDRRCASMASHMEQLYFPERSGEEATWFRERYRPHREDLLNGTGQEIRLRLGLEHMIQLHLECNLSPETIQFLGRWMPNLRVFKGVMTDNLWKAVCQWMPDLEEVGILRGSQVGEEALTGFTSFENGATREPLNIVRLNNLRRFVYLAYCGQSSIGDLSVRRGLLEMPRLDMVYICVNQQLSAEAEAALKEAIMYVTIIRNTNENCQGGWDCCAESNFLREFLNED